MSIIIAFEPKTSGNILIAAGSFVCLYVLPDTEQEA